MRDSVVQGAPPRGRPGEMTAEVRLRHLAFVLEASARAINWPPLTLGCGLGVAAATMTRWLSPSSRPLVVLGAYLLIGASVAFVIGERAAAIASVAPCSRRVCVAGRVLPGFGVCGAAVLLASMFASSAEVVTPTPELALIAAMTGMTALTVAVVVERVIPDVDPAVVSFGVGLQLVVAAMLVFDQPWLQRLLAPPLWDSATGRTLCVVIVCAPVMWWATSQPRPRSSRSAAVAPES